MADETVNKADNEKNSSLGPAEIVSPSSTEEAKREMVRGTKDEDGIPIQRMPSNGELSTQNTKDPASDLDEYNEWADIDLKATSDEKRGELSENAASNLGRANSPESCEDRISREEFFSRVSEWTPPKADELGKPNSYSWLELTSSYLNRVRHLYCPPGPMFRLQLPCPRITIVSGVKNSGRFFSAVGLAQQIELESSGQLHPIYRLRIERNCVKQLMDVLVLDNTLQRDAFLIVENIHLLGSGTDDLSEENLAEIEQALENSNSYLFLLIEVVEASLPVAVSPKCTHLAIGYESDEERKQLLANILQKHVEFDSEFGNGVEQLSLKERELLSANKENLVSHFKQSPQIHAYLNAISILDTATEEMSTLESRLIDIAKQIGGMKNTLAQRWFEQLNSNERIFGMLAVLLRGMSCKHIFMIYQDLVTRLRREGLPVDDYRVQGYFDLLRRLQIEEEPDGTEYRFLNQLFQNELEHQVLNYRNLLSGVVSSLLEMAVTLDPRTIRLLGVVIARILTQDWDALIKNIEFIPINFSDKNYEGSRLKYHHFLQVPAIALGEAFLCVGFSLSRRRQRRQQVIAVLRRWLEKDDARYTSAVMFGVAECMVSLRRSSSTLPELECEEFEELAEILKRAVLWRFPTAFINFSQVFANTSIPLSHAFIYALDTMREYLPHHYVKTIRVWGGESEIPSQVEIANTSGGEDVAQTDESSIVEPKEVGVFLRIIVRKIAVYSLIGFEKYRVFENAIFAWLLDLAASVLQTDPQTVESDLGSLSIETSANPHETPEEEYAIAVGLIVGWMNSCETDESRRRCDQWLSDVIENCSYSQRRKLAKHLKLHGIRLSEESRELMRSVLTRMLVLDGQLVDPSDESFGVLVTHGRAADLSRLNLFVQGLHSHIAHLVQMQSGFLGDDRIVPMDVQSTRRDSMVGLNTRAPLLMPLLEKLDWDRLTYILVLCSTSRRMQTNKVQVIDLKDLLPRCDNDLQKILVIYEQSTKDSTKNILPHIGCFSLPFSRREETPNDLDRSTLRRLEYEISKRVRNNLIQRDMTRLAESLKLSLAGHTELDLGVITSELQASAERLAGELGFTESAQLYRQISGMLQLLRRLDLEAFCRLTEQWICKKDSPRFNDLGRGALLLACRVARWCEPMAPQSILPILKLWRLVWKQSNAWRQAASELFSLSLWHIGLLDERCLDSAEDIERERQEMLAELPKSFREDFLEIVNATIRQDLIYSEQIQKTCAEGDTKESTKESCEAKQSFLAKKLNRLQGIQTELLLGPRRVWRADPDSEYLILLLDTNARQAEKRSELAAAYYDLLRKHFARSKTVPVLYRVGVTTPAAVQEKVSPELLLPSSLMERPNIIQPILDCFSPDQIRAVVIFGNNCPYDLEEVDSDTMANCVYVHGLEVRNVPSKLNRVCVNYGRWRGASNEARMLLKQTIVTAS